GFQNCAGEIPNLNQPFRLQKPPGGPNLTDKGPAPTTAQLLQASDVVYLGYYNVQTNGNNTTYAQGLTHRYVNDEIRFLNLQLNGELHEFTLEGKSFGDLINTTTHVWDLSSTNALDNFNGFWYEQSKSRLWITSSIDYGNSGTYYPTQISTLELNDNNTVSNVISRVAIENISSKQVYGGVQPVPQWFQTHYGTGPYVVGWGGYTSLMAATSKASLGPALFTIPDISAYASNTSIPAMATKTIADYSDGSQRGIRLTHPENYFDGGDPR